jgi:hypothetical protein
MGREGIGVSNQPSQRDTVSVEAAEANHISSARRGSVRLGGPPFFRAVEISFIGMTGATASTPFVRVTSATSRTARFRKSTAIREVGVIVL